MIENENYTTYEMENGIQLYFPLDNNTPEQESGYQGFITVLSAALLKYAAGAERNEVAPCTETKTAKSA